MPSRLPLPIRLPATTWLLPPPGNHSSQSDQSKQSDRTILHRLQLTPRGAFGLLDHPQHQLERLAWQLGAPRCSCFTVLDQLIEQHRHSCPRPAKAAPLATSPDEVERYPVSFTASLPYIIRISAHWGSSLPKPWRQDRRAPLDKASVMQKLRQQLLAFKLRWFVRQLCYRLRQPVSVCQQESNPGIPILPGWLPEPPGYWGWLAARRRHIQQLAQRLPANGPLPASFAGWYSWWMRKPPKDDPAWIVHDGSRFYEEQLRWVTRWLVRHTSLLDYYATVLEWQLNNLDNLDDLDDVDNVDPSGSSYGISKQDHGDWLVQLLPPRVTDTKTVARVTDSGRRCYLTWHAYLGVLHLHAELYQQFLGHLGTKALMATKLTTADGAFALGSIEWRQRVQASPARQFGSQEVLPRYNEELVLWHHPGRQEITAQLALSFALPASYLRRVFRPTTSTPAATTATSTTTTTPATPATTTTAATVPRRALAGMLLVSSTPPDRRASLLKTHPAKTHPAKTPSRYTSYTWQDERAILLHAAHPLASCPQATSRAEAPHFLYELRWPVLDLLETAEEIREWLEETWQYRNWYHVLKGDLTGYPGSLGLYTAEAQRHLLGAALLDEVMQRLVHEPGRWLLAQIVVPQLDQDLSPQTFGQLDTQLFGQQSQGDYRGDYQGDYQGDHAAADRPARSADPIETVSPVFPVFQHDPAFWRRLIQLHWDWRAVSRTSSTRLLAQDIAGWMKRRADRRLHMLGSQSPPSLKALLDPVRLRAWPELIFHREGKSLVSTHKVHCYYSPCRPQLALLRLTEPGESVWVSWCYQHDKAAERSAAASFAPYTQHPLWQQLQARLRQQLPLLYPASLDHSDHTDHPDSPGSQPLVLPADGTRWQIVTLL